VTLYLFGEPLRHPGTNRVVAAGQEPGVVSVQALDPGACSADPSVRTRADVVCRKLGVAFGGISGMCIGHQQRIDLRLSAAHGTA
jgi:hypothetical protein